MTIRDALSSGSSLLENSETPWLDATILLAHVLGLSREKLLASFPDPLDACRYGEFHDLILKRREGHPVAYLTGRKEFFGREFHIEEGVLCPRPDTEILVEEALKFLQPGIHKKVHDLCTGTGCIALTLKLENPDLVVSASDISPLSQKVFFQNRLSLLGREKDNDGIAFTRTSLFDQISGPFDLIVTNPPYLTSRETTERMQDGWKEPELALDGGSDGLDLIRIIIPEAFKRLTPGGALMIEAATPQMKPMSRLMEDAGFTQIKILQDLANRDRVISGIKP